MSKTNEILALEMEKEGYLDIQPIPCKDSAVPCVDEMWNQMSEAEQNSYAIFRIIRTKQYKSMGGYVYEKALEIIKDYLV